MSRPVAFCAYCRPDTGGHQATCPLRGYQTIPVDADRLPRRQWWRGLTDRLLAVFAFLILVFMGMVIFLGLFW